jgi:hypothetical protein
VRTPPARRMLHVRPCSFLILLFSSDCTMRRSAVSPKEHAMQNARPEARHRRITDTNTRGLGLTLGAPEGGGATAICTGQHVLSVVTGRGLTVFAGGPRDYPR